MGYLSAVKTKLKVLLSSEITPISEMSHDGEEKERSIESEGRACVLLLKKYTHSNTLLSLTQSHVTLVTGWKSCQTTHRGNVPKVALALSSLKMKVRN